MTATTPPNDKDDEPLTGSRDNHTGGDGKTTRRTSPTTPPSPTHTTGTADDPADNPGDIRISQRVVLVLLLTLITGCVVGGLTFLAYRNVAQAVLAGLVAAATAGVYLARWVR